jgi:hypothetical protein
MKRHSMIIAFAAASTLGLQAQSAASHIAEGKQLYTGIKNYLVGMADKMPDEDYGFKPTADIRTFGQLIGHVADVQAAACSVAGGVQKRVGGGSKTSKADLVAALKASFDICDAAWDAMNDTTANEAVSFGPIKGSKLAVLEFNTVHSDEEYGYMSVYMRLKGIVPPSSAGRGAGR